MGVQKIASLMLGSAVAGAALASAYWIHFYDLAPQESLVAVRPDASIRNDPAQGPPEMPGRTPGAASTLSALSLSDIGIAGRLTVPVSGVARTALTDNFHDARDDGARLHEGIDILAPVGTAIVAAAPGRIEKLFTSEKGGITVYIRSGDRRITYYYAHLAGYAMDLREGAAVRAGDVIGYVGSSGDADPGAPHLHFEIMRKDPSASWSEGRSVNPYPLLVSDRKGY